MALIETYQNALQRKRAELAKLASDRAKIQKKLADYTVKAQKASEGASKSRNGSTASSKFREAVRHEKSASKEADKLAKLEARMATKHKEIETAQRKVAEVEKKIDQRRQKDLQSQREAHERQLRQVGKALSRHDRMHRDTMTELERLKNLPEKITVAFFAANPLDQSSLRLDEEARAIQEMLRKAQHRDSVTLKSFWAVQPMDILQALNESHPAVVHFSGHGSQDDELVFQDSVGGTKLVTKEAIVQTMVASTGDIRLVFFNTCYSRKQAELVVQHVEAAIGMADTISDQAARIFSSQFYSTIGFGLSVAKAFEQAKAALMLEGVREEETPELFVQDGIEPDDIVVVRPEGVV
ncbi:hypothetical protein HC341_07125 [Aquisalimonas sp. 2447]|uniref:hypothetical protein n=1 Tax=Aquisalimonas sp. 2447 TaxID=2740807 RepID=UPI0014324A2E|nr:hypothetical protein [Aquisalimonas sp. 2447]QIT55006.1 hypothetical protein HC341_07125 [Aquisalimonas sp. 2447]